MIEAFTREVGRPSVMTAVNREIVLEALRQGNTRGAAAGKAGISRPSMTRWLQDPDFAEACAIAEAEAEARKLAVINKACDDGLWAPAAWWLERRRPEDYGRRDIIVHEARKAGTVLQNLSREELLALAFPSDAEEAENTIDVPAVVEYGEVEGAENAGEASE